LLSVFFLKKMNEIVMRKARAKMFALCVGFGMARFAGIDPATGKYLYNFSPNDLRDLTLRDNRGESRWSMWFGARLRF